MARPWATGGACGKTLQIRTRLLRYTPHRRPSGEEEWPGKGGAPEKLRRWAAQRKAVLTRENYLHRQVAPRGVRASQGKGRGRCVLSTAQDNPGSPMGSSGPGSKP